jgi:hypothetical protein
MWGESFLNSFENFSNTFGSDFKLIFVLLFFTAIIVIYSVFVFYFYRFLGKKNIIELNLKQYNKSDSLGIVKLLAFVFYVVEYIIILPVVTLFWFAFLAIFVMVMSKGLSAATVLTIAGALVASVRVTAYVSQKLSQDLAKMLPFTLLAISLTTPSFFSVESFITSLADLPSLLPQIPYYLIFIVVLEIIMRAFDLFGKFFQLEKEKEVEESASK